MGFFGKLFEKKECAICGGEIGLLGNRKLEDGNMCKDCAKKLSPWFSERRHSTVNEIEQQLEYRAQNREALNGFRPSRRIGENYTVIAEERSGVPYRFVVSDAKDFLEENADLILFSDISSCSIDVDESSRELQKRNSKGEMESYNPPRYEYSYNFNVNMTIENNPYFDEIRFRLNNFSVDINSHEYGTTAGGFMGMLMGRTEFDPNNHPEYRRFMKMCEEIEALVEAGRSGACVDATQMEAAAPEAPRAKFCTNCGAPAEGGKFCQHCGSKL